MEINKSTLGMVVVIAVLSTYFVMTQMDGGGDMPLYAPEENASSVYVDANFTEVTIVSDNVVFNVVNGTINESEPEPEPTAEELAYENKEAFEEVYDDIDMASFLLATKLVNEYYKVGVVLWASTAGADYFVMHLKATMDRTLGNFFTLYRVRYAAESSVFDDYLEVVESIIAEERGEKIALIIIGKPESIYREIIKYDLGNADILLYNSNGKQLDPEGFD